MHLNLDQMRSDVNAVMGGDPDERWVAYDRLFAAIEGISSMLCGVDDEDEVGFNVTDTNQCKADHD